MTKVCITPKPLLYPLPAWLVGANVDGKPNFLTVAWCGVVNLAPPMVSVSLQHHRHTLKGILQNNVFSVNVPSVDLIRETDYCGSISGSQTDKVTDCGFEIVFGELGSAPYIDQCPVNLGCRVVQMLDLGSHIMVIGRIEELLASESCLTKGDPDVEKVKPFLYVSQPELEYREYGKVIGKRRISGKEIRPTVGTR